VPTLLVFAMTFPYFDAQPNRSGHDPTLGDRVGLIAAGE
jgi:hypothetical protein